MVITDILEQNARQYGNDVALVEINPESTAAHSWTEFELSEPQGDKPYRNEITWRIFNEKANRFANLLKNSGIGPGNKVAILMMNCIEWLPIYFGILKSGALAVPMNFRYTADEIEYCADLADVDILIFGPEFIDRITKINSKLSCRLLYCGPGETPPLAFNYSELTADCASKFESLNRQPEDDAAIYFSSGTTGFPKAILHNHQSLMHAVYTEQAHHEQTKDDVFLCIPPLYHTGAKMHWFGSFLVGGRSVLLKGTKPKYILDAVSSEKCSIVWLLVPWAQDILSALDRGELKLSDYDLSKWRLMHIGAQPVPQSLIKRWLKYFPHHQYDTNYGLSESIGPGCVHLGMENVHKVGAIGIAGYGWEIKIVDEEGNIVEKGSVGELCCKGDGLMTCYYKNPEETDKILVDGWLKTGDMAMQDPDGFVFLVDRKKDVIITGGENIYPVQIEDYLNAHPAIKDVAVIGLPNERLGEVTCAIIQIDQGQTLDEEGVRTFCQELPRYKRPHTVIFADVPRNPTGKIEKPKLRKQYGGDMLVAQQNEA